MLQATSLRLSRWIYINRMAGAPLESVTRGWNVVWILQALMVVPTVPISIAKCLCLQQICLQAPQISTGILSSLRALFSSIGSMPILTTTPFFFCATTIPDTHSVGDVTGSMIQRCGTLSSRFFSEQQRLGGAVSPSGPVSSLASKLSSILGLEAINDKRKLHFPMIRGSHYST